MRAAALILLVAACEQPYSNDDLRFSRSVPAPEELMITLPDDGMAPTQLAQYYLQMIATSENINRAIFDPIGTVNQIAATPPNHRDVDVRSWGPIPTSTIGALTLYMARTATAGIRVPTSTMTIVEIEERFDFVLYGLIPGQEPFPVLSGGFASIGGDGKGIGGVMVDLDAYHRLEPAAEANGQYAGLYDTRDGMSIVFHHLAPGGGNAYVRFDKRGGAVDFTSYQQLDFAPPSALENVTVLGRWRPDNQGRADVRYDGGDLQGSAIGSECWDEQFRRTYFAATIPELGESEGSLDGCAPDLREPLFFR